MTDSQRKDGTRNCENYSCDECGHSTTPCKHVRSPAASLDRTREEFEKWARSVGGADALGLRREGERYEFDSMNNFWLCWQASRSSERERVAALFCQSCQNKRVIEDEGRELTCPVCDGALIDYVTVKIYSEQIDDLGQQVAALHSQKSSAESRVEELQRELAKMKLKLRVTDAWAREERDGRIAAESQLSELTELLRTTLMPVINLLDAISAEKLAGRYCGHKENHGHPFDWALTLDAEKVAEGMSPRMNGFLARCANACQELAAALRSHIEGK